MIFELGICAAREEYVPWVDLEDGGTIKCGHIEIALGVDGQAIGQQMILGAGPAQIEDHLGVAGNTGVEVIVIGLDLVVRGVDVVELLGLLIPGQAVGDANVALHQSDSAASLPSVELAMTVLELVTNVAHGAAIEATTGIGLGVVQAVLLEVRLHFEQGAHHLGHRRDAVPIHNDGATATADGKLLRIASNGQHKSGQGFSLDLSPVRLVLLVIVAQQLASLQVDEVQRLPGLIPVGALAQTDNRIGKCFHLVRHLCKQKRYKVTG